MVIAMTYAPQRDGNEVYQGGFNPLLRGLECCIETPARAALWIAVGVTLAALVIVALAEVAGTATGLGLALLYAGSCWALALYVRTRAQHE